MKRIGNVFEEIVSFDNLLQASKKAFRGKKYKYSVAEFYFNLEKELIEIQTELITKQYKPKKIRVFWIKEPKIRKIGASDFRDRVVHHAVCNIIEPIFEKRYIYHSFASRKGKGLHRAIKTTQYFSRNHKFFLKLDIKKYFESVDHETLMSLLNYKFKDRNLIWLLNVILVNNSEVGKGMPIGSLTSQHFANYYLDKLDHFIKGNLGVKGYLRYMDDFLLFKDSKVELHALKREIAHFLDKELKLSLKKNAEMIAPTMIGIPFLGFRIFPQLIRLKQENKRRIIKKIKLRNFELRNGTICEEKYSYSLRSLTEHLKIADSYHFRKQIFKEMFFRGKK